MPKVMYQMTISLLLSRRKEQEENRESHISKRWNLMVKNMMEMTAENRTCTVPRLDRAFWPSREAIDSIQPDFGQAIWPIREPLVCGRAKFPRNGHSQPRYSTERTDQPGSLLFCGRRIFTNCPAQSVRAYRLTREANTRVRPSFTSHST
ncbi:unnamed protein product [Microthlaspi erraticum]|uniref:Uncharacterized protein n=1 Tax=Microthlaspi erraticum TaxID=1685480 RepID=A0A6D2JJU9_9BRAS|nr:unnamed protein product [Microthlaspi erraticum]